jgi:hypothetical protein
MNLGITVLYAVGGLFVLCTFALFQTFQGEAVVADIADTITDVDFNSPLDNNNTYNLGTPFLIEYDNNTGNLLKVPTMIMKLVSLGLEYSMGHGTPIQELLVQTFVV